MDVVFIDAGSWSLLQPFTIATTALPSLNAGREIFHVASGTYSRLVPQTPEKFAGQIAGQSLQ
jgi:hypothetical protein